MSRPPYFSRHRIDVRQEAVEGGVLFEARSAELPDVVVYGTSEEAVRADMRHELTLLRMMSERSKVK
jgi:hypothetical protein